MSNPCIVPCKNDDPSGDNRWMNQHEYQLQLAKESEPDVVLIGDSLISYFAQTQMWHDLFEPLHCLNYGIGGDKVQHCLWRVQDGIFNNIKAKVVVILVGTNNVTDSPNNIVDGIIELVKAIQAKLPLAEFLVLELLPRGKNMNPLWEKNIATNEVLSDCISSLGRRVHLLKHNTEDFVLEGNQISNGDFFDFIHMTEGGYRKIFTPVYEKVQELLTTAEK